MTAGKIESFVILDKPSDNKINLLVFARINKKGGP